MFELVIGWGLSVVGIVGGIIARDRALMRQINDGDAALHERVNRTRDEFVRRDDLDKHLARIDANIAGMYAEQKETNKRIDAFMAAVSRTGHK